MSMPRLAVAHSAARNLEHAEPRAPASQPGGLRICGLGVERGGRAVVHNVDLNVPSGSYTCVLGASGSGKTTLLAAVAGTLQPSAGRIEIDGEVLSDATAGIFLPPQHRQLGMVFQDYLLWPHLSAERNVSLALNRRYGSAQARAMALEWLGRVGLQGLGQRYPAELSGGQQQRVALARALAVRPRLVLLDEPLSALDAGIRAELRALLRRLSTEHGFTAIHVTHDAVEALSLAHRLIVMSQGHVIQAGMCEEVFMRPATPWVARLTGAVSLVPVRILAREGEAAVVRLGDTRLRIAVPDDLSAGSDALLVLRPQALSCIPAPRAMPLRARLVDACFLGDRWQIEAELAQGARVTFWHDTRPQAEFETYLHPERAWAVPHEHVH